MMAMKIRPLSVRTDIRTKCTDICTNNGGWMRRVWNSVWRIGVGKFTRQSDLEGYRAKPNPVLELVRVNGRLVLMGRNQTMKMLIEAPPAVPEDSLLTLRSKMVRQ